MKLQILQLKLMSVKLYYKYCVILLFIKKFLNKKIEVYGKIFGFYKKNAQLYVFLINLIDIKSHIIVYVSKFLQECAPLENKSKMRDPKDPV